MAHRCWVRGCRYVATTYYEGDLPLCMLHDSPKVTNMIEKGKEPQAAWMHGRPIVFAAGELEYREPAEDTDGLSPLDDPLMQDVPDGVAPAIHEAYDLTRE